MADEATTNDLLLDLAAESPRPVVRLPQGDFTLRAADELTLDEFAAHVRVLNSLRNVSADLDDVDDPAAGLERMQERIIESAGVIFEDMPEDVARTLTPGRYLKIARFFNARLGTMTEEQLGGDGANSAPGVTDSTESQEAA